MNDKIKALEREVELLNKVIELTKQLEELKAKAPAYVPYPVYPSPFVPVQPYDPWPIRYEPYYQTITTGEVTISDNVAWYAS